MKIFAIFFMLVASVVNAGEFQKHELEWVNGLQQVVDSTDKSVEVKFFTLSSEREGYGPAFTFVDVEAHGKACVFVLNVGSRATTDLYLGRFANGQRDVVIKTIWLHEYAHCLRYAQRDFTSFGQRSDSLEEGFADVYALSWMYQNDRDNFSVAASYLIFLRRATKGDVRYSDKWVSDKDLITTSTGTPFEIATKIVFGK